MSFRTMILRPALPVALAMALLAGAAVAADPAPRAERYKPPAMGTNWTYALTSSGSYGTYLGPTTLRMGEGEWQGRKLLRYETDTGSQLQDDSIGTVAVLNRAGEPLMAYDPPLTFVFPLEVGKTWTHQHTLSVWPGPRQVPMTSSWRVEAYEDVTVPAGTFKAWRVVMSDNFGYRQTIWSMPDTLGVFARRVNERSATHPQGAGTQVFELTRPPG
jgi:hypothetical protein